MIETRQQIINGERDVSELVNGHFGEIKAHLIEEDGKIFMRKDCEKHGSFEDLLSIDPEFSRSIEARFRGATTGPWATT